VVIQVVLVVHTGDVAAIDRPSRVVHLVPVPWAVVLSVMRSGHLHRLVISVNGPWLSPTLLESLRLVLKALSMLLVCLD
jgi:hypothetical protein